MILGFISTIGSFQAPNDKRNVDNALSLDPKSWGWYYLTSMCFAYLLLELAFKIA